MVGVFGVAVLVGGKERSLGGMVAAMPAAQAALHMAFGAVRPCVAGVGTQGMQAMHGMHMAQQHAALPHATAAHVAAALVASWWLRRGEAALWSLLRRAVPFVPGLAAWWQTRTVPVPDLPGLVPPRRTKSSQHLRQILLRPAVSRRGPPSLNPYPCLTPLPSTGTEFRSCLRPAPRSGAPCVGEGRGRRAHRPSHPVHAGHARGWLDRPDHHQQAQDAGQDRRRTISEAVSQIAWTGGTIKPGQY
ncbi:hypothetical protein [Streptomyces violascens]|uniref:hypothetical protein n=1 Tax=Streptomyces violascens TaxID=67381 RepID=UPI00365CB39B